MTDPGRDCRIVVVDDLETNTRLLVSILERAGYGDVAARNDAAAALADVRAAPPDLILLDIHMPGVDGIAFLTDVRSSLSDDVFLPIVVITADVNPDVRRRALEAGATDFLTKPFDAGEVVLRVRNLLRTRAMHLALHARAEALAEDVVLRTNELRRTEQERLEVAKALAAPRGGATLELAAASLCDELVSQRRLAAATILGFLDGQVEVIAAAGHSSRPLRGPQAGWAASLRARVAEGPWVEDPAVVGSAGDRDWAPLLAVPLHSGPILVGALIGELPGRAGGQRLTSMMPMLFEYAGLASALVGPGLIERSTVNLRRRRLEAVVEAGAFHTVFQPIVDLRTLEVAGFEALTRFDDGARPDERFADAAALGASEVLELACVERAVRDASELPPGAWLSVNVSPAMIARRSDLSAAFSRLERDLVLEVTESAPIDDYSSFRESVELIGRALAVDDAGAGYASLRHIIELRPAFVKIDMSLVRDVDRDPSRQALIVALDHFAMRTGLTLIAEGIETEAERAVLVELGIELGQGYLLGRPAPAAEHAQRAVVRG